MFSNILNIFSWVFQLTIGPIALLDAVLKLDKAQLSIIQLDKIGMPDWVIFVVGYVVLACGITILVNFKVFYFAILLCFIIAGAIICFHVYGIASFSDILSLTLNDVIGPIINLQIPENVLVAPVTLLGFTIVLIILKSIVLGKS